MKNLLPTDLQPIAKFDMKGSKLDRKVSIGSLTVEDLDADLVYKDVDFDYSFGHIAIK